MNEWMNEYKLLTKLISIDLYMCSSICGWKNGVYSTAMISFKVKRASDIFGPKKIPIHIQLTKCINFLAVRYIRLTKCICASATPPIHPPGLLVAVLCPLCKNPVSTCLVLTTSAARFLVWHRPAKNVMLTTSAETKKWRVWGHSASIEGFLDLNLCLEIRGEGGSSFQWLYSELRRAAIQCNESRGPGCNNSWAFRIRTLLSSPILVSEPRTPIAEH